MIKSMTLVIHLLLHSAGVHHIPCLALAIDFFQVAWKPRKSSLGHEDALKRTMELSPDSLHDHSSRSDLLSISSVLGIRRLKVKRSVV